MERGENWIETPRGKKGEEAIDVTYTYDVNSILEVIVKVVSTGKRVSQVIKGQYTNLSDEEIHQRLEDLSYLKISPRDREENKLLLLRGERLYEEALNVDRQRLDYELQNFDHALKTQEKTIIEEARNKFKKILNEFETF